MKLTSAEIREKYLKFFEERGHKIVPSSSLIPENDPTTLFTGSGMQPMVPYLLGEKHPSGTRIVDSQKCFRAWDIEEVGDNTHTTFFEMLGNWSLGDYFKEEQIPWMFEFLVKKIGLDPNKLYFSVYKGTKEIWIWRDDTAEKLWKEQFKNVWVDAKSVDDVEENGMQWGRIFFYDEKENWWSRAGVPNKMPNWEPGGPDSEMFWDFWADLELHEKSEWKETHCNPACDCGRFLEIGNNVFMQYKKTAEWFLELENKNIDFGGWLERIAVALSDNPDVYMWDLFDGIRNKIEELTWKKYWENTNETLAFRVVMDHVRAATFLIWDGAVPSNKDQWYFTRRLIRRAIRFASHLWVEGWFIEKVASEVVDGYSSHYTDLAEKKAFILSEMEWEEKQFLSTLDKGLKEFDKLLKGFEIAFERSWKKIDTIAGPKAFKLYDTYGFPLEMTVELANEKGLKVDETGFAKAFEEHQAKSRAGAEQKFKWWLADDSTATTELHSATHLLLAWLNHVLGWDIHQKWSNITAERLRFDFNHDGKVERDILDKVEEFVNEAIQSGTKVTLTEMDKQKAMDEGVEWSFWEKYPDTVKVYSMVWNNGRTYSKELCWGPHVEATSDMWRFKIKKEEASSRGIRRIKAVLIKD